MPVLVIINDKTAVLYNAAKLFSVLINFLIPLNKTHSEGKQCQ